MTPKRREYLRKKCYEEVIWLRSAIANGKKIPNLDVIVQLFTILEEVIKACPVEAG